MPSCKRSSSIKCKPHLCSSCLTLLFHQLFLMWCVAATGDAISEPRIMPFILWTHRPAAGDGSVLREFLLWHFPRGSSAYLCHQKGKTIQNRAQGHVLVNLRPFCSQWYSSCSSNPDQNWCTVLQTSPSSLILCFCTFSSCSCVAATRSTRWVPHTTSSLPMWAQWKMLMGWVKPFFSYFIQHRNIFIRLHGWLPYSLFPVLKLKQQRDDSELPAWKMEVSSKLTKNFNSGLLIKWANLKGPSLPDLQFWSFLSICMTSSFL